jgi:predicted KAP-like P-loop ATPase
MAGIQLACDRPDPDPVFGARALARCLAEILAAPQQGAMVLGLHGAWGSGKSTLMDAIAKVLRDDIDRQAIFIPFNAWKYQNRDALWRALIVTVLRALRTAAQNLPSDVRDKKEAEIAELERSLYSGFTTQEKGDLRVNWTGLATESILTMVRVAAGGVAGGIVGGVIGQAGRALRSFFDMKDKSGGEKDVAGSVERVAGILHREVVERSVEQVTAIDQFLDRYQKLAADLGALGKSIYVLIDDLDRCLPDEALSIFEAIKLFLDAPECRYVIAIDRGMIRRGLALRYERSPEAVDPDEYIEKTISLSFDLPGLRTTQARELLKRVGLVSVVQPAAKETNPDAVNEDPWHTAIIDALGTNPRRLKRAANTLRVMRALAEESGQALTQADAALLLKLGLIAYRNSSVFDAMRRDPTFGSTLQAHANTLDSKNTTPSDIRVALQDPFKGLADDNRFWRLLATKPALTDDLILRGAGWFQPGPD